MNKSQSPVNHKSESVQVETLPVQPIIDGYIERYNIDISRFVSGDFFSIFQCEKTGLKHFKGIEPGDGEFYAHLMNFEWYYLPWKWEHEVFRAMMSENDKVLEIGSGNGGFLKGINQKTQFADGLELNLSAVKNCLDQGLNVFDTPLAKYASENEGKYDWVVSFQVLEHIEDVEGFYANAKKLLHENGRIAFSVPNNNSFLKYDRNNILNLPPHHMNLWDETSLRNVGSEFGFKTEQIICEPLQENHVNWYVNSILERNKQAYENLMPGLKRFFYKKMKSFLFNWVKAESENINGHSIMAVYSR